MIIKPPVFLTILLLFTCLTAAMAQEPLRHQSGAATVNGQPIAKSAVEAHAATTGLPREEALEDLIDLHLLRTAAAEGKITVPAGSLSPEQRRTLEYAVAVALGIDVPPPQVSLIVDHAWLKDAEDEKERAAGRTVLERLRTLVEGGATIPDAYTRLQVDGTLWHIGDQEEYAVDLLPSEAQDLPVGTLSKIIPGDGGLHLFKVYQRKQELPPGDLITSPLYSLLRLNATIERPEP